jgi:predicted Co/Zn/Cd cation transporter (cation efflux family)
VLLLVFSVFIMLPILLVIKVARSLFEPAINEVVGAVNEVREQSWRHADAVEREKWCARPVAGA